MNHGKISKSLARGLKELQERIAQSKIPSSKLDESINIATWNLREFGKVARRKESLHYIAEILGQFDLIAVIELRDDLSDLAQVLKFLGPYWKVVYSDYITDAGGNRERIAYIYDKRAAAFTGLASCAKAPRKKDQKSGEYVSEITWWRAPYVASFSAGSFDFVIISAHIRWGEDEKSRIKELKLLAEWVDQRKNENNFTDKDIIVMGDFNIPDLKSELFQAVAGKGLRLPEQLCKLELGSNLEKDKRYDQILYYPIYPQSFTKAAGILDFYQGDWEELYPDLYPEIKKSKAKPAALHNYFTFQISDHLPLWIQINTDIEGAKLDQIIRG